MLVFKLNYGQIYFLYQLLVLFIEQFKFPLSLFKKYLLLKIDSLYRKFNSELNFLSLNLD